MHAAMLVDSLWVLLTRLVMRAANFAVFLLLARSLGVAEFGFYGYVMSTALVLAIAFDLGLRQSGAWLIGQEPAADRAVTTHLMTLWLVLGSLGVLACWLMLEAGGYVAGYGALALVAALNVAPMLCLRTGQGVFLGRGDLGSLNRSELISRAIMLSGTIGLWAAGRARPAHGDLGPPRGTHDGRLLSAVADPRWHRAEHAVPGHAWWCACCAMAPSCGSPCCC